jgi:hypothetical protein
MIKRKLFAATAALALAGCAGGQASTPMAPAGYDVAIRGGTIYDGAAARPMSAMSASAAIASSMSARASPSGPPAKWTHAASRWRPASSTC